MKRLIGILLIAAALFSFAACDRTSEQEHTHTPRRVAAKAATCTEAGNHEYYVCTGCDRVFVDKACTRETTVEAQTVSHTGHADTDENDACDNCGDPIQPTLPGGGSTTLPKDEFS